MSLQSFSEAMPKPPEGSHWAVEWLFEHESLRVSLYNRRRGEVRSEAILLHDGDGIKAVRSRVLSVASRLLSRAELERQIDAEVIGEYPPVTPSGRAHARRRAEAMKKEEER